MALRNKPFWISLALLAAYLLLGYFLAPRLLQPVLERYTEQQFGRELSFRSLRVDPITLSFTLTDLILHEGEEPLWPGMGVSAEKAQVRMNFWRFAPAVSELSIEQPVFVLGHEPGALAYPLDSLLQKFLENRADLNFTEFTSARFVLQGGSLLTGGDQAAEKLFAGVSLLVRPAEVESERSFQFEAGLGNGARVLFEGALDQAPLWSSKGNYRILDYRLPGMNSVALNGKSSDGAANTFQLQGEFSTRMDSDWLVLDLVNSNLSGDQLSACVFDGLICSQTSALNGQLEAQIKVATSAWKLEQAQLDLDPGSVGIHLANGQVSFASDLAYQSALLLLAPANPSATPGLLEPFLPSEQASHDVKLTYALADGQKGELASRLQPPYTSTELAFTLDGPGAVNGTVQLQRQPGPNAQENVQLDLQLTNPGATLASGLINTEFGGRLVADELELLLALVKTGEQLQWSQKLYLKEVDLVPASIPVAGPDPAWTLALLQDPAGNIALERPLGPVDPSTVPAAKEILQADVLGRVQLVIEEPFASLAALAGEPGANIDLFNFSPGNAEINAASAQRIPVLARALLQRPGITVEVAKSYDSLIDRKALQAEQIRTHIALATAAELAFQTGAEPTDFNDPRVHSVMDEFAGRRLPPRVLEAFKSHFGEADVDQGLKPEGDAAAYYEALFELLVDYAQIPEGALATLARYRSQAIADALAKQGVERQRVQVASQASNTEASVDGVPISISLKQNPGPDTQGQDQEPGSLPPTPDDPPREVNSI